MTTKQIFLFIGALLLSPLTHASATYGGEGCPAGTARITTDDDGWHFILDSYELAANATGLTRKSCNIAIPIDAAAGYSMSFGPLKIRGDYDLKSGSVATLESESFFSGTAAPVYRNTFSGESNGAININTVPLTTWTSCGSSAILRLNFSVLLKTNKASDSSSALKIEEITIGKPRLKRCS